MHFLEETCKWSPSTRCRYGRCTSWTRRITAEGARANDLICSICMTLTAELLLTPCDHMFCRTCIHQALGNQSICPIDRRPCTYGQLWRMDGLSLRIWSGIKVKCGCHDIGCAWRGSIADYSAHLQIAPPEVVEIISRRNNNNNSTLEEELNLSERIVHHEDASEALWQLEILRQTVNWSIKHEMSDCQCVGTFKQECIW